jgi:hypothetical protein
MEGYINNDTLVDDQISQLFQKDVKCNLCKNIFINPIICMKCQNAFCQKCIDDWKKSNEKCPNNCDNPEYQKCLGKKDILSKLKFICLGCGNEIQYDEAEKHHQSCCPDKTTSNSKVPVKRKLRKLESNEVNQYKKKGEEISYITGKKIIIINNLLFILYI